MTRKQLIVLRELINEILQGLNGNKFEWNQGQRYNWVPILRKAGIALVSATQLKKHGYRLKKTEPSRECLLRCPHPETSRSIRLGDSNG